MLRRLPDLIDPREFAERRRRIVGGLALSSFGRLREALAEYDGEVRFELVFGRSERLIAVEGWVEAVLVLECQRCLESLSWPVRSELRLAVVASLDEAARLPAHFEPLLVAAEQSVAPADIVEDELLLAIPAIPRHPVCQMAGTDRSAPGKDHPFAVLAALKHTTEE